MASLLYGAGLRLNECLQLRVKDLDFSYRSVFVRDGKGRKDRVSMLPERLVDPLHVHLGRAKRLHEQATGTRKSPCRERSPRSVHMPATNGPGSLCFPPRIDRLTARPA